MWQTLLIWAEDAPPANNMMSLFLPGMLILAVVFMLFLPKRREAKERQQLLSALSKNDKVQTIGGIVGTIVTNNENEEHVTLKIDDNCKMKILRGAIARNITKEEALAAEKSNGEKK